MDENFENKAENLSDELNKAAEEGWETVKDQAEEGVQKAEESLETAAEEVKDDFMQASAETWSEVPEATPITSQEPAADRWGSPEPVNAEDPNRWQGQLYTPGSEEPPTKGQKTETPQVVDYVPAKETVSKSTTSPEKKDKFPVWAIILIVVLVLLCLCSVLLIGGLVWAFDGVFSNLTQVLHLMV